MAASHSLEEIRKYLSADSLHYLSREGMVQATGLPADAFCLACYDGHYPVPFDPATDKLAIERRNGRRPGLADALVRERAQIKLL